MRLAGFLFIATLALNARSAEPPIEIAAGGSSIFESQAAELEKIAHAPVRFQRYSAELAAQNLVKGKVDALLGGKLADALALAAGMSPNVDDYVAVPVNRLHIKAVVHPDNPIDALKAEEIRGILKGEITNWESVSSVNGAIRVFLARDKAFVRRALQETYLSGAEAKSEQVSDHLGALRQIKKDRHAISFFPEEVKVFEGFSPKYLATDAFIEVNFIVKKSARQSVLRLLEHFKKVGPVKSAPTK